MKTLAVCEIFEEISGPYYDYMSDLENLSQRRPGWSQIEDLDAWFEERRVLNHSPRRELTPLFLAGLYCKHNCEYCPVQARLDTLPSETVVELRLK